MSLSADRKTLLGVDALLTGERPEVRATRRRSPARGIMIGLGLAAILWTIIILAVMSVVRG